jgi:hypothetical protein
VRYTQHRRLLYFAPRRLLLHERRCVTLRAAPPHGRRLCPSQCYRVAARLPRPSGKQLAASLAWSSFGAPSQCTIMGKGLTPLVAACPSHFGGASGEPEPATPKRGPYLLAASCAPDPSCEPHAFGTPGHGVHILPLDAPRVPPGGSGHRANSELRKMFGGRRGKCDNRVEP